MPRQIRRLAALAEIGRQVDQFVRPALERNAEVGRQRIDIHADAARQNDAIGGERSLQPVADDGIRHQRGDLDADVVNAPAAFLEADPLDRLDEPGLGQVAGQEEEPFSHCCRASIARSNASIVSTTVVSSNDLSFSVFSRSIRRG